MQKRAFNNRVLIIDDEETIRDSFREILIPRKISTESLDAASSDLFGDEPVKQRSSSMFDFELKEAATGRDGLILVQQSLTENNPFAAIFVDMRMPGWDGLKTVQHIRKFDERAEIIFVTAYSDYSIDEVVEKAGSNVSYHCKPFSVEEIRQIATKAVYEWNKARNLEDLIKTIAHLRTQQWDIDTLLNNILHQVAEMMGVFSAMLAFRNKAGIYKKLIGIGSLSDDETAVRYLNAIPELGNKDMYQTEQFFYFKLEKYGILALFEHAVGTDRIYIVRLFLEHAAQAITNVELHDMLMRKEKLSAIGQAISMVAHDLRGPIGSICQGIELAEEMADKQDFVKEMHKHILIEAKKSLNMVNDILDFTRNLQLIKSPTDVKILIGQVQKSVEDILKEQGVTIKIDIEKPFYFPSDQSKMQRVLVNLIKNGVEAFKYHKVSNPIITVSAKQGYDGFHFHVEDNGPGLPEQVCEKLFVPFVTYEKKGGTGLGLAIVKHFVEAHGGKITVETSPKGTRFVIFLPEKS